MIEPNRLLHLVGSVPFTDAGETFARVSATIGDYVSRIPDGETGERSDWIRWQLRSLGDNAAFEGLAEGKAVFQSLTLRRPQQPVLTALGYADAAIDSYVALQKAVAAGRADPRHKLQISLPTPVAITGAYMAKDSQALVLEAMEEAMREELRRILEALPHNRIALQWDVAIEIAILEGVLPWHGADGVSPGKLEADLADRISRLIDATSPDVELGIHLCYGDSNHRNFKKPVDLAMAGSLLKSILASAAQPVDFVHAPVPHDGDHADYFRPLQWMAEVGAPWLYLGLIHRSDGREGARRRIAAARQVLPAFGIAAACGFGRRPRDTIEDFLMLHRQLADEISAEKTYEP